MTADLPASLLSCSLEKFLDQLAMRVPAPGGGSAAALTTALAAATARMVVAYSLGPKTALEERGRLEELADELERCDRACRRLIDEDAAAFEAVSLARREVKHQAAPAGRVEEALRLAIAVPLSASALAANLLRLLDQHRELLKPALRSDLAVAAHLALAACRAAVQTASGNVLELGSPEERAAYFSQIGKCRETAERLGAEIVAYVDGVG